MHSTKNSHRRPGHSTPYHLPRNRAAKNILDDADRDTVLARHEAILRDSNFIKEVLSE